MRNYLKQITEYYEKNESIISAGNWKLLKKMTIVYLIFLVLFYFFICYFMRRYTQAPIILSAIILQIMYSAIIYIQPAKSRKNHEVNCYLFGFGVLICVSASLFDTVFSPNTAAIAFPIVLILMGQIYSVSPFRIYCLNIACTIVFLILSRAYKADYIFCQDLIAVLMANVTEIVCSDIIMHQRLEVNDVQRGLKHLSHLDQMTGLYNKVTLKHKYKEYFNGRVHGKTHGICALAVIDMDGFKQINDKYGHHVGDQVLIGFAEMIKSVFPDRKNILLGRFGGDEFVVFLRNQTDKQMVQKLFDTLNQKCNQMGLDRFGFPLSCSIGVTVADHIPQSFASFFITADQELYTVKSQGGNRCQIVERNQSDASKPRMLIVDDDAMTRTLLGSYFNDSFQLVEAGNGITALENLKEYEDEISIMLMDLEMPEMDGRAVLEKMREEKMTSKIPVLIVSSYMDNNLNLKDLGVAGLIPKPFQPEEVRDIVERTLLA